MTGPTRYTVFPDEGILCLLAGPVTPAKDMLTTRGDAAFCQIAFDACSVPSLIFVLFDVQAVPSVL